MRELRDALEQSQQESQSLRQKVDELSVEVESLKSQLSSARAEQERLAQLVLQKVLNPGGQKSAFSVADVAELVAYLKKP